MLLNDNGVVEESNMMMITVCYVTVSDMIRYKIKG